MLATTGTEMATFWRGVFAVVAFFNFAVGGAMLIGADRMATQLDITGAGGPFIVMMAGVLIATFGLGYALVALAPAKHRGIVWIGATGKAGVVVLAAQQFTASAVPQNTFLLSLGDLTFVLLFALFLWRGPRA